jgi:hypothetical protein
MRQVREVLRLRTAGVGLNEIARRVGVAPSTVRLTLRQLASAGFEWPLPAEMTDTALEAALFAAAGTKQGHRRDIITESAGDFVGICTQRAPIDVCHQWVPSGGWPEGRRKNYTKSNGVLSIRTICPILLSFR